MEVLVRREAYKAYNDSQTKEDRRFDRMTAIGEIFPLTHKKEIKKFDRLLENKQGDMRIALVRRILT